MSDLDALSVGYVVVPHPNTATFRVIGRNHIVSFIPETYFSNPLKKTTICVWLGASDESTEVFIYLIWPGKGLLDFSPGLNHKNSSRVVRLIEQTDDFTLDPRTEIARDLLLFNNLPCLLFVRWSLTPDAVLNEAISISFPTRMVQVIERLKIFLESVGVKGDAVSSLEIANWYKAMGSQLKKANRQEYLFSPAVIVLGVMEHLIVSLRHNHQLDVVADGVDTDGILIPLRYVRRWASDFTQNIVQDPLAVKVYATVIAP